MLKKILIGTSIVVLGFGVFIADTAIDAGALRDIEPHFGGTCEMINGAVGVEDITIDPSSGLAYLSAHDRRAWSKDRDHEGAIYLYRTGSLAKPLVMPHDMTTPFFPHGISLWKNPTGHDRLFVVNHPHEEKEDRTEILSQVEVFDIVDGSLQHVRTVTPEAPYSLNDVAALDGDRFYASIDRGSLTPTGRMLEAYGRLARGGIAFGDANGIRKAAGDLVYPNGIQVSPDGSTLYVAETTGERLLAFTIDKTTGTLTYQSETEIDSGLDNLEWDKHGDLWIGSHPRAIDFPAHGANAANRSASQVLRVRLDEEEPVVTEVYLNDGNPMSGSSVGAPYKDRLLIGAVFEPFILDCERTGR